MTFPKQAMTMALDNLGNQVSYATDFTRAARTSPMRSTTWPAPAGPPSATCATISKRGSTPSARRWPRPSSAPRSPFMATAPGPATAFEAAVDGLQGPRRSASATAPTMAASCATPPACWRSPPSSRRPGVDIAALTAELAELRDRATLYLDPGGCLDAGGGRRAGPRDRRRLGDHRWRGADRHGLPALRPGAFRHRAR